MKNSSSNVSPESFARTDLLSFSPVQTTLIIEVTNPIAVC